MKSRDWSSDVCSSALGKQSHPTYQIVKKPTLERLLEMVPLIYIITKMLKNAEIEIQILFLKN